MNKQQREFKKQMQESLLQVKKENKEKYYDYIKWNNLEDVESRRKREFKEKVINIISSPFKLIFEILFILFILSSILGIFHRLTTSDSGLEINNTAMSFSTGSAMNNQQKNIINYFNKINTIRVDFNELTDKRNTDIKNYNKGSLSRIQYLDKLTVYENEADSNLNKLSNIECPGDIAEYKNLLIEQYTIFYNLLDSEISYYSSGDKSYLENVKEYISDFNIKNKESENEFNNIRIKYNIN